VRNSWLFWTFIIAVIITVLVAFNYQGGQHVVPLSEIFPDEEIVPIGIEYEFVDESRSADTPQTIKKYIELPKPKISLDPKAIVKQQKQSATKKSDSIITKSPLTIQVASFKDKKKAEVAMEQMKGKGYEAAYIRSKDLGEKGMWHRVNVGKFQTQNQAKKYLNILQKDYQGSFIISIK